MFNELHVQAALASHNARLADAERAHRLRVPRQRRVRVVIGRSVGSERVLISVAIARGS